MFLAVPCPARPGPEDSPKRAAILGAGARLFMSEGYDGTSMDAVAREAGVSKATVYAHFAGKDSLFAAIVGERCAAISAEAEAVAARAASADGALRELGRAWMGFLLQPESLAIHRTVIAACTRFPELARAFHAAGPERGRHWLTAHLAAEQRAGRLRADADPVVAADHLMGLLRGETYLRCILGGPAPDAAAIGAVVDRAVEAFLRAYGPPGGRGARAAPHEAPE